MLIPKSIGFAEFCGRVQKEILPFICIISHLWYNFKCFEKIFYKSIYFT